MNEIGNQTPEITPNQAPDKQERNWAMFCHLAALAGYLIPLCGSIVGPLVVWLLKKEEYPLVDDQGKESLNFQITVLIMFLISFVLLFVVIGFFLMFAVAIFNIVMIIMATIKASEGERYRYPFAIRLIK